MSAYLVFTPPSLPGHGFSDKATEMGWGIPRIAGAWIKLMRRWVESAKREDPAIGR